jgi:hypothetical protein
MEFEGEEVLDVGYFAKDPQCETEMQVKCDEPAVNHTISQ